MQGCISTGAFLFVLFRRCSTWHFCVFIVTYLVIYSNTFSNIIIIIVTVFCHYLRGVLKIKGIDYLWIMTYFTDETFLGAKLQNDTIHSVRCAEKLQTVTK